MVSLRETADQLIIMVVTFCSFHSPTGAALANISNNDEALVLNNGVLDGGWWGLECLTEVVRALPMNWQLIPGIP